MHKDLEVRVEGLGVGFTQTPEPQTIEAEGSLCKLGGV